MRVRSVCGPAWDCPAILGMRSDLTTHTTTHHHSGTQPVTNAEDSCRAEQPHCTAAAMVGIAPSANVQPEQCQRADTATLTHSPMRLSFAAHQPLA